MLNRRDPSKTKYLRKLESKKMKQREEKLKDFREIYMSRDLPFL